MGTTKSAELQGLDRSEKDQLPQHARSYIAIVNDIELEFDDPKPSGRQILQAAGFEPVEQYVLIQLVDQSSLSVLPRAHVDLDKGDKKMLCVFENNRVFRFTLDDRVCEWGREMITEAELRQIAGIGDNDRLMTSGDGGERPLNKEDQVELNGSETERIYVSKRTVVVLVDNEIEIEIPVGKYTTEELVDILDVSDGYRLNMLDARNTLVLLEPGEVVVVEVEMKFITQVPQGGSS